MKFYSTTLTLQYFKFDGKYFLLLRRGSALVLKPDSHGISFVFQQAILRTVFLLAFTLE